MSVQPTEVSVPSPEEKRVDRVLNRKIPQKELTASVLGPQKKKE